VKIYTVYASIHSAARSGDIWHYEHNIKTRLIRVKPNNGKTIIASNRIIDLNFENLYNSSKRRKMLAINKIPEPIIMDEFYRKRLGIQETGVTVQLSVTPAKWYDGISYLLRHPNDAIMLASYVGIIGTIVGIISIIIALV
jgi:hypothetical protein